MAIDVRVDVLQGISQTLLFLAVGREREVTLDEAMKLM
jgi:hypothetical protein